MRVAGPPVGPGGADRVTRLGVDVGSVRIGVAISHRGVSLALPLETVRRDIAGGSDLRRLAELVDEHGVVEVIVGLPRTLAAREGVAAVAARAFGDALAAALPVPVIYVDERLTTVVALQQMRAAGRNAKQSRAFVDQAAAAAILQGWLDTHG